MPLYGQDGDSRSVKAKLLVLLAFGLLLFSGLATAGSHGEATDDHDGDHADGGEEEHDDDGHADSGNQTADERRAAASPQDPRRECAVERDEELAEAAADRDEAIREAREDRDEELQDPDSDAEDREEAWQEYNETVAKARSEYGEEAAEIEADYQDCLADARRRAAGDDDRSGRRDGDVSGFFEDARFIAFTPDGDNDTLFDYTVRDVTVLDEARYLGNTSERERSLHGSGSVLEIRWGHEDRIRVHDNPTGLLQFKAEDDEDEDGNATGGGFLFDFVDSALITPTDDGARVQIGDRSGILVAPHAEWVGNDTVVVAGFASFHFPVRGDLRPDDRDDDRDEHDEHIDQAIAARRVAAQVSLGKATVTGVGPGGNDSVEILAFDDVDVQVSAPDRITGEDRASIMLSAELSEGRTFVLDVDRDRLGGPDLELAYFDHLDDGTVREVVFQQADSLQDVLDPNDASDVGPEYWIVQDANGLQVLVSVDHWSVHEITLASIGDFVTQPSIIAGAIAGVLGTAVAATAMLWPRRLKD